MLVSGVVQGVGFRPFVYKLASQAGLAGSIGNDTAGVTIEVEGAETEIKSFLTRLRMETPALARIDSITVHELKPTGEEGFRIVASEVLGRVSTGIPADAATCADCLRELLDPMDRRYRYPFINCTNCGPRFTITKQIPYDRPQTSMARFTMCMRCQAEYDDPRDRRFHAQPNACWDCGPRVWLESPEGKSVPADDPIAGAIEMLRAGQVLGIKGIGGFHLSVDATSEAAVKLLRQRKRRYGKPLAVMVRDVEAARSFCMLNAEEEAMLLAPARPIVIARGLANNGIANEVAPGIPWLGIFLPYAPLQHLLFAGVRVRALVMTSANLSEEPIAIDNVEARTRLEKIVDGFLMHDREILQRCDDSVAGVVNGAPQLLRRARGFVPLGVSLPMESPPLLGVGGHLKNAFALARGKFVFQSQHFGDLENLAGIEFFEESLNHFMRTFEIDPEIIVHDMHPGYLSTNWAKERAKERRLPLIAVQHHHAHIVGCMSERCLTGPVIGIALDGTGYGTDGRVWGGEVMICQYDGFERFAHLDYVPMPGGEAAIRNPWRMALGHLHAAGFNLSDVAILDLLGATKKDVRLLERMIERDVNAPLTSSCGRLFDAVAAVILGCREVDYEAQAAIELEGLAVDEPDEFASSANYRMEILDGDWSLREPCRLNVAPLWRSLIEDLRSGVSKSCVAARFHASVAAGFALAALRARAASGIIQVALSGGCMHNRRLARLLRKSLEAEGFEVYEHRAVSPGDGGLSYGQVAVGAAMLQNQKN